VRRGAAAVAVRVALDKRVPIGAGLGGGSSDAAHTLVALDRLLSAGWPAQRLAEFAGAFGSDTPFFVAAALGSPSCACRGRGEVIRPVARPAARRAVVFSPPFGLSTRDVYARFDEMGLGFDAALEEGAEPDWDAWAKLPVQELLARLVNDLEAAAFSVSGELSRLRAELQRRVGRVVRMSGSGSSLFTLFDAGEGRRAEEAAGTGREMGVAASVVDVTPAAGW
jgi:4-diphosphocytidyl-2-C-methyl-D-erythritol kinase